MAALNGSQTVDLVSSVLARFGNGDLHGTVCNAVPILAKDVLEQITVEGELPVVNITNVATSAGGFVTGAGLLPQGNRFDPSQGSVLAAIVFSRLSIDRRIFSASKDTADGVNMLKAQGKLALEDLQRILGTALINAELDNPAKDGYLNAGPDGLSSAHLNTSSTTDATYSVFVQDLTRFRIGMGVHVKDVSASTVYCFSVSNAQFQSVGSFSSAVAGVLSLKNDVAGIAGASGHADSDLPTLQGGVDQIYPRGYFNEETTVLGSGGTAVVSNGLPISLFDISGTGDLHSLTGGVKGWSGLQKPSMGTVTPGKFLTLFGQVKLMSGMQPTHVIMNPIAVAQYAQEADDTTVGPGGGGRVILDSKLNKYDGIFDEWESGVQCNARPVISEPNCPAQHAVLHNRDGVKLAIWKDIDWEMDIKDRAAMIDRGSTARYILDAQIAGEMNLYVAEGKRNCMAYVTGITGV